MPSIVAISASADAERVRLPLNYVRSTEGAGLAPMLIPPLSDPSQAARLLAGACGLLLTGGEDVDPRRYGATAHAATQAPNVLRDDTELELLRVARARQLPVLAICRGMQLINVALGGSLVQDIPSLRPSEIRHDQPDHAVGRCHSVSVIADSTLARAMGVTTLDVNSYHHQCVDRVAPGLFVNATAPDGIIEGFESTDPGWWMLAVQWHPEDLTRDVMGWERGIFRAFAEQAARFQRTLQP